MDIEEFITHFQGVKATGRNQYMACCPAHDDRNPSLSISASEDGGKLLMHCFAGCEDEAILSKVGLKVSDLFVRRANATAERKRTYEYRDEAGRLLYTKIRWDQGDGTKTFAFEQPDGTKSLRGARRVPYNLPAVCQADKVYFVEGEKCADAVNDQGFVATTLDSGANSKWLPEFSQYFERKTVTIIPDNDEPGMEYAMRLKSNIPGAVVRQLPGLKEKEDIYDWLKAGHTMTELDALRDSPPPTEKPQSREGTQADRLLKLCSESELKIFADENNELYAAAPVDHHTEVFPVASEDFNLWLQRCFHRSEGRPIRAEALNLVKETLVASARFSRNEHIRLFNRVGSCDSAFWYDLVDEDRRTIRTSADGWEVWEDSPTMFRRYRHQKEQALPQKGGDVSLVLKYVNITQFKTLFLSWLVACFVPGIPHPMPILYGEKGAAKSTACVIMKRLIDPSALENLTLNHNQRDLVISLKQHYFLPFDNVSSINGETSDTLCRAITGGSIQQRRLFTDAEDYIFTFMRCMAINGINNVANRADLLDRALLFELERVPENGRRELSEVYRDFEKDRPAILGGIFDALSAAMSIYPALTLDRLPRMADFGRWGYAIAEALGGKGNDFLEEYARNRGVQNAAAIEADVVATLMVLFMKDKSGWEGRVSDLLRELNSISEDNGFKKNSKSFPSQPNALSRRLNGIKSNLESVGISFRRDPRADGTYPLVNNDKISSMYDDSSPFPSYHVDPMETMGKDHGGKNGNISGTAISSPQETPCIPWESGDAGDGGDDLGVATDDIEF